MKLFYTLFLVLAFTSFQLQAQCPAHPDDPAKMREHCALFALVAVENATHIAIADGSWFDPTIWQGGIVPTEGADVVIDSAIVVTYDGVSETNLHTLRNQGTLQFATNVNTRLKCETIISDPFATIIIGTELEPVQAGVTAEIIFSDGGPIDIVWDPFELSKGMISHGTFISYGAEKTAHLPLATAPAAGSTSLELASLPIGWQIGDQLVLGGTYADFFGNDNDNTRFHDEELTITSINSTTVTFTNNANGSTALLYDHIPPAGYSLEVYVANITRNIQFRTENADLIPTAERAHFMGMHNPNIDIYYTGFYGLGRTDKNMDATDPIVDALNIQVSGGENPRGRYGCHFHRTGSHDPAGNPSMVIGNVLVGTPGWGFVNHNSHVVMENNVAYDFVGSGFITEDGNELGAFRHNIAIKGRGDDDPGRGLEVPGRYRIINFDLGFNGEGFWMQTANVSYEDNIAISCAGSAYFLFTDDDALQPANQHLIPVSNIVDPVIAGGLDSVMFSIIPVREMHGFTAYNCGTGFGFWMHMRNNNDVGEFSFPRNSPYTHNIQSIIEDLTFWNLLNNGLELSYTSQIHFRNALILGDIQEQFANIVWPMDRGNLRTAVVDNGFTGGQYTFENMHIEGWERAMCAFSVGDPTSTDDYNYNTSQLINSFFDNNTFNLYPENRAAFVGGGYQSYDQFRGYFEIESDNVFNSIGANTLPFATFTTAPSGGLAVAFDASASIDSDTQAADTGNGIASYVWNFGDGNTGYGDIIHHVYDTPGTYPVTLLVYDDQGATNTYVENIEVCYTPYAANQFVDGDFESGNMQTHYTIRNETAWVGNGWIAETGSWYMDNGVAVAHYDTWSGIEYNIAQVIQNDAVLRGNQVIAFDAINQGVYTGPFGGRFTVQVVGINSEFEFSPYDLELPTARVLGDATFEATILLQEELGANNYAWTTFEFPVNFGDGYQFIAIRFVSSGFQSTGGNYRAIDNLQLATPDPGVIVQLNAFLQGAYDSGSGQMVSQINDLTPLSQPFNTTPWNYGGTESVQNFPPDFIDWVFVEARDAADPTIVVAEKAALLLENGDIVEVSGQHSGLLFTCLLPDQPYYFSLKSRHHLAVLSAAAFAIPNVESYDFTLPTNVMGSMEQLADLGSGIYGLLAGDWNSDGILSVSDFNGYTTQASSINQYLDADFNLDRNVTVADFNLYLPNASVIGVAAIRY